MENFDINVDTDLSTSLTHLRFTDDIMLFPKSPEDITTKIEDLATESERIGLKLNPEKTRMMTNGEETTIKVGNTKVDHTDEYIYLRQLDEEVNKKIMNS